MKQRTETGFTLIEILVVVTLAILVLGALFSVLRIGFKASGKGAERLLVLQRIRKALLPMKRDVQECAFKIKVHNAADGSETALEIHQPAFDAHGYPFYDQENGNPVVKIIVYRFDRVSGTLYRNDMKKVEGLEDLEFATFEIIHGGIRMPALRVEFIVMVDKKEVVFRTVITSRYLSYWARDPNWVQNATSALVNYGLSD